VRERPEPPSEKGSPRRQLHERSSQTRFGRGYNEARRACSTYAPRSSGAVTALHRVRFPFRSRVTCSSRKARARSTSASTRFDRKQRCVTALPRSLAGSSPGDARGCRSRTSADEQRTVQASARTGRALLRSLSCRAFSRAHEQPAPSRSLRERGEVCRAGELSAEDAQKVITWSAPRPLGALTSGGPTRRHTSPDSATARGHKTDTSETTRATSRDASVTSGWWRFAAGTVSRVTAHVRG
jgi:hypothetical protein